MMLMMMMMRADEEEDWHNDDDDDDNYARSKVQRVVLSSSHLQAIRVLQGKEVQPCIIIIIVIIVRACRHILADLAFITG